MSWTVNYHADAAGSGFVEVTYAGMVSAAELCAAVSEAVRVARAEDANRVLTDCTALQGGHSVFDLYRAVEMTVAAGLRPVLHEAVLVAPHADMAAAVDFWRTAATNRGMVVRVFQERGAALEWLNPPASR